MFQFSENADNDDDDDDDRGNLLQYTLSSIYSSSSRDSHGNFLRFTDGSLGELRDWLFSASSFTVHGWAVLCFFFVSALLVVRNELVGGGNIENFVLFFWLAWERLSARFMCHSIVTLGGQMGAWLWEESLFFFGLGKIRIRKLSWFNFYHLLPLAETGLR